MSKPPVSERKVSLALCVTLLAESILFAVIALSKLALYIDCFGFTQCVCKVHGWRWIALAGACGAVQSHNRPPLLPRMDDIRRRDAQRPMLGVTVE